MNSIPKDLPIEEYIARWKQRNLSLLKRHIEDSKSILKKLRKYNNNDARLVGRFLENITISAEAIGILSCKYFEGEITVLAGTIIEGFSLMQYCLKNKKSGRYFDYLAINSLLMEYRTSEVAMPPKDTRKQPQIEHDKERLKELKDEYLKPNKQYNEVIAFLESDKNSPADKRRMIKDSYKEFTKRSIESMVNEFIKEGLVKVTYEKYCHVKHHHLDNTVLCPKTNYIKKEFFPFDELTAISSAAVILNKLLLMYKEMREKGDIEEKCLENIPS